MSDKQGQYVAPIRKQYDNKKLENQITFPQIDRSLRPSRANPFANYTLILNKLSPLETSTLESIFGIEEFYEPSTTSTTRGNLRETSIEHNINC
jgi:hypothetical protein